MHLFIHLLDKVKLSRIVHARWVFILEKFTNTLKGFVKKKARPIGLMLEGWSVQESCVYISKYLVDKKRKV